MSKEPLKVGDRVRVYGADTQSMVAVGVVEFVTLHGCPMVRLSSTFARSFHPKQCRRLKKRERRLVYIERTLDGEGNSNGRMVLSTLKPGERVEFLEVRKRK